MDYPQEVKIAAEIAGHFEGCHLKSYIVPGEEHLQATIGRGIAIPLSKHPMTITQAQADQWFMDGLMSRWHALKEVELKPIWDKLTVYQKAAVLSFRYNCVTSKWLASDSRKLLNAGNLKGYADMVDEWNNHGLAGLVRRRAVERHVFERGSLDEVKRLNWYQGALMAQVNAANKLKKFGHLYWSGAQLVWRY